MKRCCCLVLFVLGSVFIQSANAQNLVPNPSFECGSHRATWFDFHAWFHLYVCDWFCPNFGTSDVFSTALSDKSAWASMPFTGVNSPGMEPHVGSMLPRTGKRFVGFFNYNEVEPGYAEYFATPFTVPLVKGKVYCGEFYAALAGSSTYATNNIGIALAKEAREGLWLGERIMLDPVVNRAEVLEDTTWQRIYGNFVAPADANFILIGNFYPVVQMEKISRPGWDERFADQSSYYFVDDVAVYQIPFVEYSSDTVTCDNRPVNVKAVAPDLTQIRWTTLNDSVNILSQSSTLTVAPKSTTSFLVRAMQCGVFFRDTVTIRVMPSPRINLGKDTTLCEGETVVLDAGEGAIQYNWNDGTNTRLKQVVSTGAYSATVTNDFGCSARDTVNVTVLKKPEIDLGSDSIVCQAIPSLAAGPPYNKYLWSDGSIDSTFFPTESGLFWVEASNQCGTTRDSIRLYGTKDVFIPNVITFNQDNLNETFRITVNATQLSEPVSPFVSIFNKWGIQVFSSKSYKNNWPQKNSDTPAGIYYYKVAFEGCPPQKGWLQVIR